MTYLLQNLFGGKWTTQEVANSKEIAEYLRDVYYPLEITRIVNAS